MTTKPLSDEQIGLAVRSIRKSKKFTAKDFAKECDLTAFTLCKIESGKQVLRLSRAAVMCKVLQISLEELAAFAGTLEGAVNQMKALKESFKQTTAYSTDNDARDEAVAESICTMGVGCHSQQCRAKAHGIPEQCARKDKKVDEL